MDETGKIKVAIERVLSKAKNPNSVEEIQKLLESSEGICFPLEKIAKVLAEMGNNG